jgi:hypothetical protein
VATEADSPGVFSRIDVVQRQRRQARGPPVGEGDLGQRTRFVQVRVVDEVLGTLDRRERQPSHLAQPHDLLPGHPTEGLLQAREELLARGDALSVGGEIGVVGQVAQPEHGAERLPLRVRDDTDEDLLVVAGVEH